MTKRALQVNTDASDLSAAIELENRNQVITHATEEAAAARERWSEEMSGPLTGIRIVMMGGLGPGPFCGMLLGGLGADVVRVDRVTEVDQPPPIDTVMRRSQRSIAVDMKHPQGRGARVRADRGCRCVRRRLPARRGRAPRHRTGRSARPQPASRVRPHDGLGPGRAVRPDGGARHQLPRPRRRAARDRRARQRRCPPLNLVGDYGGGGMLLAVGILSAIVECAPVGRRPGRRRRHVRRRGHAHDRRSTACSPRVGGKTAGERT